MKTLSYEVLGVKQNGKFVRFAGSQTVNTNTLSNICRDFAGQDFEVYRMETYETTLTEPEVSFLLNAKVIRYRVAYGLKIVTARSAKVSKHQPSLEAPVLIDPATLIAERAAASKLAFAKKHRAKREYAIRRHARFITNHTADCVNGWAVYTMDFTSSTYQVTLEIPPIRTLRVNTRSNKIEEVHIQCSTQTQ